MKISMPSQKTRNAHPQDERGFIMVMALLMLVVLSIMGGAAMLVRNTEQAITVNTEVLHHNFYAAEAVTLEGAAEIAKTLDAVLLDPASFPAWLRTNSSAINLTQSNQWPSGFILPRGSSLSAGVANITPAGYASNGTTTGDRIWYAAVDQGVCSGSSLTDETRTEKCYSVFGMYDVKAGAGKAYTGRRLLTVGYKKVLYL